MRIAIVVSPKFRDLDSIQRYISRLRGTYTILLRQPPTKGERLARMTAQRKGFLLDEYSAPTDQTATLSPIFQRVSLVKGADKVVVFASLGDRDAEHVLNLAEANSKDVVHFREV